MALVGDASGVLVETKTFRTAGGRPLRGEGGITPDVVVLPESLTTVEKAFARNLTQKGAAVAVALNQLSREFADGANGTFTVTPGWRDSLFARLTAAGVKVERAQFDSAQRVADRLLEDRVAQIVGGDSLTFRRDVRYDAQLDRAVQLLQGAKTQVALLAEASK